METSKKLVTMTMTMLLLALPAAASDYTLEIFGNAKEDETINMQDVTQIELTILGKEKELTLLDTADRIVRVDMPVEKIVVTYHGTAAVIKAIGAEEKVVCVSDHIKQREALFPVFSKLSCVGSAWGPDTECILKLEQDLVIYQSLAWGGEALIEQLEPVGIPVSIFATNTPYYEYWDVVKEFGYIFEVPDKADEYIDWYQGHVDIIAERVEGLSEEDKTRVLQMSNRGGSWYTVGGDLPQCYSKYELAGGISVSADLPGTSVMVDPEWIVKQNPSIIMKFGSTHAGNVAAGYGVDDTSEAAALREDIMNHPAFALTDAAKEGDVHIFGDITDHGCYLIAVAYMAKLFQPDLFEDMDPKAIQQEYLTRFQHLDYDVYEHGVFLYPMPWKE